MFPNTDLDFVTCGIDMSVMQRFPLLITIIMSVQFIDHDHYVDAAVNGIHNKLSISTILNND